MHTFFSCLNNKQYIDRLIKPFADSHRSIHNILAMTRLFGGLPSKSMSSLYTASKSDVDSILCNYLIGRSYVKTEFDTAIFYLLENTQHNCIECCVYMVGNENGSFKIGGCGDEKELDTISAWCSITFESVGTRIDTAAEIYNNCLTKSTNYINPSSVKKAKDSFYPWLSIPLVEYFDIFMASEESVLLLFGPPGTGKSTFVRSLIHSGKYHTLLAYNKEVVESSMVMSDFIEGDARILVYEDIDRYLGNREDGNAFMATLLNASEGVIAHPGKKIIISTNLPTISKIDPALLRVGRCFDILEFEELTAEQASSILADMGMEQKDFSSRKKWTLSEVLGQRNVAIQITNRFGKKAGFQPG